MYFLTTLFCSDLIYVLVKIDKNVMFILIVQNMFEWLYRDRMIGRMKRSLY